MDDKKPYELDELIRLCEIIKVEGHGTINPIRACYTLALEIKYLHKQLDKLGDIVYGVD